MKKDTFIFYLEWLRTMEDAQLSNSERSKLIDAIVIYADKGTTPVLPRLLTAIFSPIKATIDRDFEKYALKAATNRENGARGGRPKRVEKPKETQENPVGYFGFSEKTEKTQSHDNVNDNVNDNVFVNDARSVAPDEKEKRTIYEIFFWRNLSKPLEELDRFWEYNSQRKWKALNTPAARMKAASEWQPVETKPRVKAEFLEMWRRLATRVSKEKGWEFAAGFVDANAKCVFQNSVAKIMVSDPAIREYIMQARPQEILDYIGEFKLTTAMP
jgi:hypothetical protein